MDKVIRNIPDDVAELLKKQAKASGLTLEAYIRLKLIELVRKDTTMTTIKEAIQETGVCEAYHDGYTIIVREDENEMEDILTFSVQSGGMPPHFQKDFSSIAEVEEEIRDRSHFPADLDWSPVEGDN